jgi:hypothetical protein
VNGFVGFCGHVDIMRVEPLGSVTIRKSSNKFFLEKYVDR